MVSINPGDQVRITEFLNAAPVGEVVTVERVDAEYVTYGWDGGHGWYADTGTYELVGPITSDAADPADDPVNHPSHYTFGKYEVLDVIEDWGLSYHLGNATKYIARAGRKDPAKEKQDLEKAVFYINRRIAQL
jgi:hypothetical protein